MEKIDPNNIEFKLSQLLDGDLSPDEQDRLLARLRDDEELSRTYAGYRRLDAMLEDLIVAPELSQVDYDAQRADIIATLEKRSLLAKPRPRVIPWVYRGALAAAATVLLAIGATMVFKTAMPDPTPGPTPVGGVASAIVPPRMVGSIESSVAFQSYRDESAVSLVQIRVNYLDDNEFMLSDPDGFDKNPLADTGQTGPFANTDGNTKPLPAGTVLMVLDQPVEREFDWFDVF